MPKKPTPPIDDTQRFPVAGYEFRATDYQQLQLWAKALQMTVEEVVTRLAKAKFDKVEEHAFGFEVEDGAIVSLVWDYSELRLGKSKWKWVQGLGLQKLAFVGYQNGASLPSLPVAPLRFLWCVDTNAKALNLEAVPELTHLYCHNNKLTELDLTPVPLLKELGCSINQLTELDLTPVPLLEKLVCSNNQLTQLDLTPVPLLRRLDCDNNQLTQLDLTPVPQLKWFYCKNNRLTQLDLRPTPELNERWWMIHRDPHVQIIR